MADAKKGIPAVGGAAKAASNVTGQKKKSLGLVRKYNGKTVRPFLFDGRAGGHGKYYGGYLFPAESKDATVWDQAVLDEQGKPLPFKQIGELIPS